MFTRTSAGVACPHGSAVNSTPRIALVVFVALLCVVDVLWIRANAAPPRMYDDAFYLIDSVNLVGTLQERGLVPFLRECLEATKGHPPMIKILPVPFYLLLGTGTASALYAYIPLIVIFCLYLYSLTKLLFSSEEIAFVAVVVTALCPLTYGLWRNVMAEFGTAVATMACLYHLLRSDGFRIRKHVILSGAFFGWGLLWKISFLVFLTGPFVYVFLASSRSRRVVDNLMLFGATVLLTAGPFYAIGGREVVRFARMAAQSSDYTELWSLGPVLSPKTVMLYWLNVVNFGFSFYLFLLFVLLVAFYVVKPAVRVPGRALWVLVPWMGLPLLFFSFQVLKEVRHLLPALPVFGICVAVFLRSALEGLRNSVRVGLALLLVSWPAYQLLAFSFDAPYLPREDVRLGPFILSIKNLELASLQLSPTYTFPANPVKWPLEEIVSIVASHASGANGALPRVRVVGEHPYLSGLVLTYQAALSRTPITSPGRSTRDDPRLWDFSVLVCGPEGKYGPLDYREPEAAAILTDTNMGLAEIGRVRIPSGCDARIYKKQ